jgi:hypothetical protein
MLGDVSRAANVAKVKHFFPCPRILHDPQSRLPAGRIFAS